MEESILPANGQCTMDNFDSDPQRDISTNLRHKDTFKFERLLGKRSRNQSVRTQELTLEGKERKTKQN